MKPARVWAGIDARASLSLGRSMQLMPTRTTLPLRRRITGGGAVLRGPWLLRGALRVPRGHGLLGAGPSFAAHWFGQVHARWLRRMGLPHVECYEGPVVEHWSCFAGRLTGEVLVGERKITGIAQAWRRDEVLVTSGTLLSAVPWTLMAQALGKGSSHDMQELDTSTVNAQQCLGPIVPMAWAVSLYTELSDALFTANASNCIRRAVPVAPGDGQPLASIASGFD